MEPAKDTQRQLANNKGEGKESCSGSLTRQTEAATSLQGLLWNCWAGGYQSMILSGGHCIPYPQRVLVSPSVK